MALFNNGQKKTAIIIATNQDHPTKVVGNALRLLEPTLIAHSIDTTALYRAFAPAVTTRFVESRCTPAYGLIVVGAHGILRQGPQQEENRRAAGLGLVDGNGALLISAGQAPYLADSHLVLNACLRYKGEFARRLLQDLQSRITILGYNEALTIGTSELWERLREFLCPEEYSVFSEGFCNAINAPVISLLINPDVNEAVKKCRACWMNLWRQLSTWNSKYRSSLFPWEMMLICESNSERFMHMTIDSLDALSEP